MASVIQIDGFDPVASAPVVLRAASHDDAAVCHLDGQTWWPALSVLPKLRYDLFDGAFASQITTPSSTLTMQVEPWPDLGRYMLADARIRIWTGEVGANWGSWTLRFDGRVATQPRIADGQAQVDFAVDDRWLDEPLLKTYAGTTGAEGAAALKGQVKPLALGAPRYAPGVLVDAVALIFQVSGYGAVEGFEAGLERLARFGAPVADYPNYAALDAAVVPAGRWATCNAQGFARLGAPPTGQISFLLRGDRAGPNGWARKPGQLIRRLALLSGGAGKIDDASLDALDAARPYDLSVYVEEQTTARELIQRIAASVNAVAMVSWTGKLLVLPVALSASTITLAADGTALPPVVGVEQLETGAPWKKLTLTAERSWTVHALSDIAFTAALVEVGSYADGVTYREGNIVTLADGSRWLYVFATPSAGNAPAVPSAYWSRLSSATQVDWSEIRDPGGTKPADNADVTGENTSKDTAAVGGRPASEVIAGLDRIEPIINDVSALELARVETDAALGALDRVTVDLAAAERQAARDAGRLDEALLRLLAEAGRTRNILRDAGVVVDPVTGVVRIYAVDQIAERTARAEVTLDGQRALISTKASVAQVDERIAMAVLDPSQVAELGSIIARLTEAEQVIDGLNATVSTKATAIELAGVAGRVTTAEQELDALAGEITTKVEQTDFDLLSTRTSSVEQTLTTLGDTAGLSVTIRQTRAVADGAGEAALRAVLAGNAASRRRIVEAAEIRQDLYTRILDGERVEATARLTLAAQVAENRALAIQETTAGATRDTALSQRIDALGVVTDDQAAAIGTIQQASITAAGGLASLTTTVRQQVRGGEGTDEALLRALIAGDQSGRARQAQVVQIQTELSTELVAGQRATALVRETLLVRLSGAEAAIADARKVAADANASTAGRTSALEVAFATAATDLLAARGRIVALEEARASDNAAFAQRLDLTEAALLDTSDAVDAAGEAIVAVQATVAEDRQASVDRDEANATAVQQVTARLDGVGEVGVEEAFEAVVDRLGRIEGTYTVKVDVNGNVTGFQLIGSEEGPGSLNLINTDLRMGTGRVIFANASHMLVQGVGFGADANLLEWFGPTRDVATCAPANAISFKALDGRERMGGALTNGVVGYDQLQMGAVQKAAFFTLPNDVVIPRGSTVQVVSLTFTKEDASSIIEITFNGDFSSTDDLQFVGTIQIDGVTIKSTRTNIILVSANAAMPITPFAYATGIAAGERTVTFVVQNAEADNVPLTIGAGSTIKVVELRKGSIGSSTGSGGGIVNPPPGGGGGGGGGYIGPNEQQP